MPSVTRSPFGIVCTTVPFTTKFSVSPATRISSVLTDVPSGPGPANGRVCRTRDVLGNGLRTSASAALLRSIRVGQAIAHALPNEERAVLSHDEIQIVLLHTLECTASHEQAIEVRMAAGFQKLERTPQRIGALRGVGRVPIDRRGGVVRAKPAWNRREFDVSCAIRIGGARAAIGTHLPACRRLGESRGNCETENRAVNRKRFIGILQ